jgi:hypothetical protein
MIKENFEIDFKVIPQKEQRYDTTGDWWWTKNTLHVRCSALGNRDWEFLIFRHEVDEAYLCKKRGISEKSVMMFDLQFDKDKRKGQPGDALDAPYRKEHFFATNIERLMAAELKVDWAKYDGPDNFSPMALKRRKKQ